MLGPLTSIKKTELLGIGHQRESLEPATSIAAMKNYPKHSNLKKHEFLSSRLVGHKSKMAWQN